MNNEDLPLLDRCSTLFTATTRVVLFAFLIWISAPAEAHHFGGPTDPAGPSDDGCPECCDDGGGECPPGGSGCARTGGPVNLWDGAERHTAIDVSLGGYIDLNFRRFYDNQSSYDSPVGHGWGSGFDLRLFRIPNGDVVIRKRCGLRRYFVGTGGGFDSPPGESNNNLADNRDGTYSLSQPLQSGLGDRSVRYDFDTTGRLARVVDERGNGLGLEYDPAGRLPIVGTSKFSPDPLAVRVVAYDYRITRIFEFDAHGDDTGRELVFAYDRAAGRLDSVTDHQGRVWKYTHDEIGNLVAVEHPSGLTQKYEYEDPLDVHALTTIDEGYGEITNTYDDRGRVSKQALESGTVFDIVYDDILNTTVVTKTIEDADGTAADVTETIYEFDEFGRPIRVVDAQGNERLFDRDDLGRVMLEEQRDLVDGKLLLTGSTEFEYGSAGRVIRRAFIDGQRPENRREWNYDYHEDGPLAGRLISVDGPRTDLSDVTRYEYYRTDSPEGDYRVGDLRSMTNPEGHSTEYLVYDLTGRVKEVADPNGVRTSYSYNALGLVATVAQLGRVTAF